MEMEQKSIIVARILKFNGKENKKERKKARKKVVKEKISCLAKNIENEDLYSATTEEVVKSKRVRNFVATKHICRD